MIPNVGPLDRALRLVLGAGLILAAAFGGLAPLVGVVVTYGAVVVGLVLVATAFLRICPLYAALGISTCRS